MTCKDLRTLEETEGEEAAGMTAAVARGRAAAGKAARGWGRVKERGEGGMDSLAVEEASSGGSCKRSRERNYANAEMHMGGRRHSNATTNQVQASSNALSSDYTIKRLLALGCTS